MVGIIAALLYALRVEPNTQNFHTIANHLFYWYIGATSLQLLALGIGLLLSRFRTRVSSSEYYKQYVVASVAAMPVILFASLPPLIGAYLLRNGFVANATGFEHKIILSMLLFIIGAPLSSSLTVKMFNMVEKYQKKCLTLAN